MFLVPYLIAAVLGIVFLGGGYLHFHERWTAEGREECRVAIEKKDAELKTAANAVADEVKKHDDDLALADKLLDAKITERIIYRQAKGVADVRNNPSLSSAACTLPASAVQNLNAARASLRRDAPDPAPISVRDDASRNPGAGSGPAPDRPGIPSPVRRTDGDHGVPSDSRRPLSKDAR